MLSIVWWYFESTFLKKNAYLIIVGCTKLKFNPYEAENRLDNKGKMTDVKRVGRTQLPDHLSNIRKYSEIKEEVKDRKRWK